jgi:hypothetical protein
MVPLSVGETMQAVKERNQERDEGRTKVTGTSVYQSVEDRDGMIRSGMERGANESWDMLDELLPKMSAGKNSQSTV